MAAEIDLPERFEHASAMLTAALYSSEKFHPFDLNRI
jgi:hypothetical protein